MAEKGFKRKLTAIFSADVVEYSRLMDMGWGRSYNYVNSAPFLCFLPFTIYISPFTVSY
jgi:hypothetical protein